MPPNDKKMKREQGTVVAYHRYVQGLISSKLNSISLGPGFVPFRIAITFLPLSLVFLVIGLFLIMLRTHHYYLVGPWRRALGPFFIVLFILCFGAAVYFWDMAVTRTNKFRRKLKFQAYGQYGTKVIHESHVEREKMIKGYKSGTAPHRSTHKQPRYGYPTRRGANNEGYDRTGERARNVEGMERRPYHDHPYSDDRPPPKYDEVEGDSRRYDPRDRPRNDDRRYDDRRSRPSDRPRDGRPRDDRPRDDRRRDDRPRDDRSRYERRDEKPRYDRPLDEKPRYDRPLDEKPRYDDRTDSRVPNRGDERRVPDRSNDEYAVVDKGRRGRYASNKEPRVSTTTTRYESQPDKFYDEVPHETVEPAEEHHVVSRRTAQPSVTVETRYSERYVDESGPMVAPGRARQYDIEFSTDTQDSAV